MLSLGFFRNASDFRTKRNDGIITTVHDDVVGKAAPGDGLVGCVRIMVNGNPRWMGTNLQPPLLQFLLGGCPSLMGSLKKARAQTRIYLKHEVAESAIATGAPGCITGWCPTLTLLLICSSLSGENGHPMQIYSLLSLVQIMGEDFRYPNGQHLPTTGSHH